MMVMMVVRPPMITTVFLNYFTITTKQMLFFPQFVFFPLPDISLMIRGGERGGVKG